MVTYTGHHMTCVKRKAASSMRAVGTKELVEQTINDVFDTCYYDTEPFDRIP